MQCGAALTPFFPFFSVAVPPSTPVQTESESVVSLDVKIVPEWDAYEFHLKDPNERSEWIKRVAKIPKPLPPIKPFIAPQENLAANFFPELGRLFYRGLTFDRSKPATSLYETHCIIQVYICLFNLVALAFKAIRQQSYVLNTIGIIAGVSFVWHCFKAGRSPERIDFCKRLQGDNLPVPLWDYSVLKESKLVIAHGPFGVGKSAWIQGIAGAFKGKKVFLVESEMMGAGKTPGAPSTAEKLAHILKEAQKDPAHIVIVWDEVGDAWVGPDMTKLDVERFEGPISTLKNIPGLTFIGVLRTEQWDKICEKDGSFKSRCTEIVFNKPENDALLRVLRGIVANEAPHIGVSEAALDAIIVHTNKKIKGKGGQPRQAVDFLRKMIANITSNQSNLLKPQTLIDAKHKLKALQKDDGLDDTVLNDPQSTAYVQNKKEYAAAEEVYRQEKIAFKKQQGDAARFFELKKQHFAKLEERNALARKWVVAVTTEDRCLLEKKIDYIHYVEKKQLENKMNLLKKSLAGLEVQIDVETVARRAKDPSLIGRRLGNK